MRDVSVPFRARRYLKGLSKRLKLPEHTELRTQISHLPREIHLQSLL